MASTVPVNSTVSTATVWGFLPFGATWTAAASAAAGGSPLFLTKSAIDSK